MYRNHFIIGIMPNKEIWLRAKELRNIEVIPLNKEGVAFCNTASLDIEVLSVSICAMRFGLPVSEGGASIHPVHDSRLAPLVIVPPTDIVEETLPKVKDGDSESTIRQTYNYHRARHKWEHCFHAIEQWLNQHRQKYRIGFNSTLVDISSNTTIEDMAIVLAFLDVFPNYSTLFD